MGVPTWPRLPPNASRDEVIADIRRMQRHTNRSAAMALALAACGLALAACGLALLDGLTALMVMS